MKIRKPTKEEIVYLAVGTIVFILMIIPALGLLQHGCLDFPFNKCVK